MREEEKNERLVRALLKLPANRRCINCNSMGPQYVCTSFSTFICTNCSGIHREFTHRVKSISMAKFTSQEVSALQEGGNERAKEIYFKHWDSPLQLFPDSSDVDRLRNFIKNVYVDRRYMGEVTVDRPPQIKGDGEGSYGNSNADSYKGVSKSPSNDGTFEHNYSKQHTGGSPAYERNNLDIRPVDHGTDQEERTTNGADKKIIDNHRSPNGSPKPSGRSDSRHKGVAPSNSSLVEPSKVIRAGTLPVRLPGPPNSHKAVAPASAQLQKAASSRTNDPSSGTPVDVKLVVSKNLIDFDSDPQPPEAIFKIKMQKNSPLPSTDVGWATFDVASPHKATVLPTSSSASTLETQLLQLSTSRSAPSSGFSSVPNTKSLAFGVENHGGQQQQLSLFPEPNIQSNDPPLNRTGSAPISNQLSVAASVAPLQGTSILPASRAFHRSILGVTPWPPSMEASSSGRAALAEDLFTMRHQGWRISPHVNVGYGQYNMQYPAGPVNATPTFAHPRPINSFDTFPTLTSIQGALPDISKPAALSSASSMGSMGSQWLPLQQIPHSSAANPGPYMVQQRAVNMPQQLLNNTSFPIGYQVARGFGTTGSSYGLYGMDQQMAAQYPQSFNQNYAPQVRGNPFV